MSNAPHKIVQTPPLFVGGEGAIPTIVVMEEAVIRRVCRILVLEHKFLARKIFSEFKPVFMERTGEYHT